MAVIKNKRRLSRLDYWERFNDLYKYSLIKTKNIPTRRKRYIAHDIDSTMNRASSIIGNIPQNNIYTKEERYKFTIDAINELLSLQPHLLTYWNINHDEIKKMVHWANLINVCIERLNMRLTGGDKIYKNIMILDRKFIQRTEFMKTLSKLHEFTHDKVVRGAAIYDDTYGICLVHLVGDALWHMAEANRKIPKTSKEYQTRLKHINAAISDLRKFEPLLVQYVLLNDFSEDTIQKWYRLQNKTLKLLYGLKKSDAVRFKDLPEKLHES